MIGFSRIIKKKKAFIKVNLGKYRDINKFKSMIYVQREEKI
jgi:hypothetical protein